MDMPIRSSDSSETTRSEVVRSEDTNADVAHSETERTTNPQEETTSTPPKARRSPILDILAGKARPIKKKPTSPSRKQGLRVPTSSGQPRRRNVSIPMILRRRAREVAFQVLYQNDQNTQHDDQRSERFIRRRLQGTNLVSFAQSLVEGVGQYRTNVDLLIKQSARNWTVDRMTATDRTILRLGAYELLYSATPARVAVNEAVELARRYGTSQSSSFVNGILDDLLHTHAQAKDAQEQAARREAYQKKLANTPKNS